MLISDQLTGERQAVRASSPVRQDALGQFFTSQANKPASTREKEPDRPTNRPLIAFAEGCGSSTPFG